jgi:hypothetical protein
MLTPDLNLLRDKIGLAPGEDFPWVHELCFSSYTGRGPGRGHGTYFTACFTDSNHTVSIQFLRSLLRLSRLDRKIDQRNKSNP